MIPADVDGSEFPDGDEPQPCPSSTSSGRAGRLELVHEAKGPMVDMVAVPARTSHRSCGHDFGFHADQPRFPHRDACPVTHDSGRRMLGGLVHQKMACGQDPPILLLNPFDSPVREAPLLRPILVKPGLPQEYVPPTVPHD